MRHNSQDDEGRRIRLAEAMLEIEEEAVITAIEKIVSIARMERPYVKLTIEKLNARLDEALADSKAGRVTDVDDLLEEIKNWHI